MPDISVHNVTVIDSESGNLATQAAAFMTQLKQTSGVDVAGAINSITRGTTRPEALPPEDEAANR